MPLRRGVWAIGLALAVFALLSCGPSRRHVEPAWQVQGGRIPVLFEANAGQLPDAVSFVYRAAWGRLTVERDRLAFTVTPPVRAQATPEPGAAAPPQRAPVQVALLLPSGAVRGADAVGKPVALGNLYDGRNPGRNRTGLPLYREVRYREILPGLALSLADRAGRLFLEAELAAGVDLGRLRFRVTGSRSVAVDARGHLALETELGAVQLAAPRFFARTAGGAERELPGRWVAEGSTVGLQCPGRASGESLRIDPEVVFAGFPESFPPDHEGFLSDGRLAVEGTDRAFVAAHFSLSSVPATWNSIVYALKIPSPGEMELVYRTVLENVFRLRGMATDGAGRVFLAGTTSALSLPPVPGPSYQDAASYQDTGSALGRMMALLSLAPATGTVDRATYVGEPAPPEGNRVDLLASDLALGVDENGEPILGVAGVLLLGAATPGGVMTLVEYFGPGGASASSYTGGLDACFLRLSPELDALVSMDIFAAESNEIDQRVRRAGADFVLEGASRPSDGFETTVGAYQNSYGTGLTLGNAGPARDLFVRRYGPDGSVVYSTLLGGPAYEWMADFAVDPDGRVATTFELLETGGGLPVPRALAVLSEDGSELVDARILSDTWVHVGPTRYLEFLPDGTLVGVFSLSNQGTSSVSPNAFDTSFGGGNEILFVVFDEDWTPAYLSYLGGYNMDLSYDLEPDEEGGVWITGVTVSGDFPATVGEPVGSGLDGESLFLARIAEGPPDFALSKQSEPPYVSIDEQFVFTITVTNVSGETSSPATLVDTLPQGLVVLALPAGVTLDGPLISIPVPALEDQESHSVGITVKATAGGQYVNQVQLVVDGAPEALASAATTALGPSEVPELYLRLDGPETIGRDQAAYFTLRLRNLGPGEADGVVVSAHSPNVKDIRFTGATLPEVVVSPDGSGATWTVGTLPPLAQGGDRIASLTAVSGGQVGEVVLTAQAETPTLASAGDTDDHPTVISGATADLSIEALEPEVVGGKRRWRFVVSETTGSDAPVGPVTVDVSMHGDLYGARYQEVTLVSPGPNPAMNPILVDSSSDLWVAPISLDAGVGLPQTVVLVAPQAFALSDIRARLFAPGVVDANPANDEDAP